MDTSRADDADTRKPIPWFQAGGNKRHETACPACDTPVRILGLVDKPGPGFERFDPIVFGGTVRGKRSSSLDDTALSILALVITQFDRIVHVLKRDLGFRMSRKHALDLLTHWFDAEGYLYREATLRNIPWMVAYRARALSLYGQRIEAEALRHAIADGAPDLRLEENGRLVRRDTASYQNIMWCCIHHTFGMEDERLEETPEEAMEFVVTVNDQDTVIHRKTISFDPAYFSNLIRLPENRARRDVPLLNAARDVFLDRLSADTVRLIEDRAMDRDRQTTAPGV